MKQFYLYRHIRNDLNIPFYIGIGVKPKTYSKNTQEYKRAYSGVINNGDRSGWWRKLFNKINKDIEIEIMYESDSWDHIKQKEREFIKLYGRKNTTGGSLVNLTDGGEGVLGMVVSKESIEKARLKNKGRKLSPEHIERLRAANMGHTRNLGRKAPIETRIKMSLSAKKIVKSDEWLAKIKKSAKNRKKPTPFTEKHIENMVNGRKGYKHSEETKNKIRNAIIGTEASPECRRKIGLIHKGKIISEATKRKMSISRTGLKHSEETKAKMRKPKSEQHKLNIKLNHWSRGTKI